MIDNLKEEFEKLEDKILILKSALEFYADEDNWVEARDKYDTDSNDSIFNAYDNGDEESKGFEFNRYIGGVVARKALSDIEKI